MSLGDKKENPGLIIMLERETAKHDFDFLEEKI